MIHYISESSLLSQTKIDDLLIKDGQASNIVDWIFNARYSFESAIPCDTYIRFF
jgi:hypothetical protein